MNSLKQWKWCLFGCLMAVIWGGFSCSSAEKLPPYIREAGESFQKHRDYASLKTLVEYLRPGMTEAEVKRLLGEPDYSPIDGQYYYASDSTDATTGFVLGAVVQYTRRDSTHPEASPWILERVELMPIGE